MNTSRVGFAIVVLGLLAASTSGAVAQDGPGGMGSRMMDQGGGPGMMGDDQGSGGMDQRGMGQETMGQGMMGPGMMGGGGMREGMMGQRGSPMMGGGMGEGRGCPMMHSRMMHGGMHGMMGSGMRGSGMMGSGMMDSGASRGMGMLFGSRVRPVMNLSVDDVRSYLASRLDLLGNKRLKVGNVTADGGAITAEIVTVDNSLVQRLKVDPHTGRIEYED
jgi:hypothetical protein